MGLLYRLYGDVGGYGCLHFGFKASGSGDYIGSIWGCWDLGVCCSRFRVWDLGISGFG